MVTIPEFILFGIVNKALDYLRTDYNDQVDKSKSYLGKILIGNSIERYDLMEQAKKVFIDNDVTNERFLQVNLMFNMERQGLPTIHLTLPSEQTQTSGNGIGVDQGYVSEDFIDTEYDSNGSMIVQGSHTPVYTRRFQSTYNIVITSDNSNEVILIYHTLKSLLISLIPSISLEGLENVILGGQDVQLYDRIAPKNVYIRAISFNAQYETSVPDILPIPMVHGLTSVGTAING